WVFLLACAALGRGGSMISDRAVDQDVVFGVAPPRDMGLGNGTGGAILWRRPCPSQADRRRDGGPRAPGPGGCAGGGASGGPDAGQKGPAMPFNHVLVPTDLSDPANHALRCALEEATVHRARVTVLHVLPQSADTDVYYVTGSPDSTQGRFDPIVGGRLG